MMTGKTAWTATVSCEDSNKTYITFPDGLRIIHENGRYIGWYVCGTAEGQSLKGGVDDGTE